ncbi:peptidoglycan DD-metalloendopeptidase family protein [bacterium]|jgi:septal ring factor EnvC (AmiA/AmiB activator)|nr:peptidoglycan DD-metalloendopeptidase family protein [bacterium]
MTVPTKIPFSTIAVFTALLFAGESWIYASVQNAPLVRVKKKHVIADQLSDIRAKVMVLESDLLNSLKNQGEVRGNIKKIQVLMKLQQKEQELSLKRHSELERTVQELESRRNILHKRIADHQVSVRQSLRDLEKSIKEADQLGANQSKGNLELEKMESPRRRVLTYLVETGLHEIEEYRVDLADADHLEERINDEKHQLAFVVQDLKEKEGILEFNKQLQLDLLKRKHADRIKQLESYRKLKVSEAKVEKLMSDFNVRVELDEAIQTERKINRDMAKGEFVKVKGQLPKPVANGKVVTSFGRFFDGESKLFVFKKGIDISGGKEQAVQAIFSGKIAFSGELPDYGRVAIVDHGGHFYSLCAHLGETKLPIGTRVKAGDVIGKTDIAGTPVYFEIRSRNVPVNPLQWISN